MGSGFHFEEGADLVTINGRDIPVFLAVLAAALALEIFLSLKKDGRLGLALPGLWLIWRAAVLVVRAVTLSAEGRLAEHTGLLLLACWWRTSPPCCCSSPTARAGWASAGKP